MSIFLTAIFFGFIFHRKFRFGAKITKEMAKGLVKKPIRKSYLNPFLNFLVTFISAFSVFFQQINHGVVFACTIFPFDISTSIQQIDLRRLGF